MLPWGRLVSLYRRSADALMTADPESVVEHLLVQFIHGSRRRPSPAEQSSWRASLPELAGLLVDAGLGAVEVMIEHPLPLTSRRADVVLAGYHPRSGAPSYVVVELKQWSAAHMFEDDPGLVVVPGMPGSPKLHPVLQVQGYVDYLSDYLTALQDLPDALSGLAYLHNATNEATIRDLRLLPGDIRGQLFTAADRADLQAFLLTRLSRDVPGASAGDALLRSGVGPSKQLLKLAADEVRNREQFHLLDEQRLAFDSVLHAVNDARSSDQKRIIVVSGGPGSGKSVIALALLGELSRRGRSVLHATGSRSFTQTLRRVAGHRAPRVQSMFKYFNQFMTAGRNELDVLILDEAHRIRETSVDRYTRAELRTGRPQVDELVAAARVPVFLLDQHQVVRPGEMGSLQSIKDYAQSVGLSVLDIPLRDQFRCGGSEQYVRWVLSLLGLEGERPEPWEGDDRFDVEVVDSPEELEARLQGHLTDGYSARISAGYCWPWSDPRPDGTLVPDVRIGPWARPWNVKGDRRVGDAPPAPLWATEQGGFGQVGCIYTAQGFEYDWSGVILGPDLVWREGRLVSNRDGNKDPDFRNRTRVSDADFDGLVRNVYKVLLTRGMRGTLIHSTDHETNAALADLVSGETSA